MTGTQRTRWPGQPPERRDEWKPLEAGRQLDGMLTGLLRDHNQGMDQVHWHWSGWVGVGCHREALAERSAFLT